MTFPRLPVKTPTPTSSTRANITGTHGGGNSAISISSPAKAEVAKVTMPVVVKPRALQILTL